MYFFQQTWRAGRIKLKFFVHEDEIVFLKKLETKKIFGQPFNVKLEIYKREFCSFLVFLQEEFQKKTEQIIK